ncbi:MAG TPA: alpha/beta fold hydrolase [Myxococcaceae bacterium]|nr:alpha/beta fold hydrolase [Myxococcaceae bacterium]
MPAPALALAATLLLHPCRVPGIDAEVKCGTYAVPEDRAHPDKARRIDLNVVVLPSRAARPAPDPLFVVSYVGPGATNTENAADAWKSWWRDARDVVMVDLRGTNGPARLDCPAEAAEATLHADLDTIFPPEKMHRCVAALSKVADLTQYTTAASMDDLDEVRAAMGYDQVNLYGNSWGTRAALIYLRRHPQHVRSAILEGIAALSMKNPLTHARVAQQALDRTFEECDAQPSCKAAFPRLREEFAQLMKRLHEKPAEVTLKDPETGVATPVQLTWQRFAEGLRVLSYRLPQQREIPRLLHRAAGGDLVPFAEAAATSNRRMRDSIRLGNLLSITCAEDLSRIGPGEIERECSGTYLGDSRVREQMTACEGWPRGPLEPGYGDPVRSRVPVFLLSGTLDPVTPPPFGAETAKNLPRSVHVVAPGTHVPGGPCIESMEKAFLQTADPKAVDQRCVKEMKLPPLAAP